MDPFTNRRIYDSDNENWKENRKKSLHDPMNVRKDSNKDFGESSKSKVDKIHQKREKKQQPLLLKLVKILVKESHMYHEFLKIVIMYQTISLIHKYSVCYSVLVDALIHELDVYHMISYVSRVFENCYHVSVNKFNNCAIKCAC